MKKLANDIGDEVGGRACTRSPACRAVHPGADGGLVARMRRRLVEHMVPDWLATVETMKALAGAIPAFERPTE